MKRLLRNTFYLMIMAWCFLLNGYELLGIFVGILITIYISYNIKISNYWRVISLFLVISLTSLFFLNFSNLTSIYQLLFVYLIIMSLNTALVNEICFKLRKEIITPFFITISVSMIIFYLISIIVKDIPYLPYYKSNIVLLNSFIYIPSFMVTGLNLLYKFSVISNKQNSSLIVGNK